MRLSNRAKNFGCSDLYTNVCGQCFTDKMECNCLLSTCCTSSFPGSSPANRIGGVWERSRLYSLVPRILPSKPYRSSLGMRLYSLVPRLLPSKPYRSGLGTRLYNLQKTMCFCWNLWAKWSCIMRWFQRPFHKQCKISLSVKTRIKLRSYNAQAKITLQYLLCNCTVN